MQFILKAFILSIILFVHAADGCKRVLQCRWFQERKHTFTFNACRSNHCRNLVKNYYFPSSDSNICNLAGKDRNQFEKFAKTSFSSMMVLQWYCAAQCTEKCYTNSGSVYCSYSAPSNTDDPQQVRIYCSCSGCSAGGHDFTQIDRLWNDNCLKVNPAPPTPAPVTQTPYPQPIQYSCDNIPIFKTFDRCPEAINLATVCEATFRRILASDYNAYNNYRDTPCAMNTETTASKSNPTDVISACGNSNGRCVNGLCKKGANYITFTFTSEQPVQYDFVCEANKWRSWGLCYSVCRKTLDQSFITEYHHQTINNIDAILSYDQNRLNCECQTDHNPPTYGFLDNQLENVIKISIDEYFLCQTINYFGKIPYHAACENNVL